MFRLSWAAAAGLAALLSLVGPAPAARAEGDLPSEIKKVAQKVHAFLKGQGEEAIGLGQFTGPANFPSSAGPGVQQLLSEELAKLGVAVKKRAKLGIKGEYTGAEVDDPDVAGKKRFAVALKGEIVDGLGKRFLNFDFEVQVTNEQAMAQLLGVTVNLPPKATDAQKRAEIKKAYVAPTTTAAGSVVQAGPGAPFGMELIVDGSPVVPKDDEGLPFAPIQRHQKYAVRLHNRCDHEVAVAVTIDGLSVFSFAEIDPATGQRPAFRFVFIPPRSHYDLTGWYHKAGESFEFEVVALPKAAAAELNQTADVGTITAVFHAAWEGDNKPADEPPARMGDGDATGRGPPVKTTLAPVSRTVGRFRGSVSIRYTKGAGG